MSVDTRKKMSLFLPGKNFFEFSQNATTFDIAPVLYCPTERQVTSMFSTKNKEMQKAIDTAWSNPTAEQKLFQERYFPTGKPSVKEFIETVSAIARQKQCS